MGTGWREARGVCIDDMCVMCRVLKQPGPAACASRGRWEAGRRLKCSELSAENVLKEQE